MKINLLLYFVLVCQFTNAQQGIYNVKINQTQNSGYHKIKLSPELVAVSNTDLSDIRILDKSGQQVPYYVEYSQPRTISNTEKIIFKFKHTKLAKQSEYVFESSQRQIDYLNLIINNTKVNKQFSVLGSNNQKNWYSIIDKEYMTDLYDNNSTSIHLNISLPKTNYSFYKIIINDSNSAPIVVSEISNSDNILKYNSDRVLISNFKLIFNKLNNDNIIEYSSNYKYKIDEMKFKTLNKGLFQRNISISSEYKVKKRIETQIVYQNILTDKNLEFKNLNLNGTNFKIKIDNGDNQPVDISNIEFYQYPIFLIAHLDSTQNYIINTSDKSAKAPIYDIVNFKDKIGTDLPILNTTDIEKVNAKLENSSSLKFYQHKWFMWTCLAIGVVVVFSVSISMINSMNKKDIN